MSYTGHLDAPPMVILQSRRQVVSMLFISMLFVATSVWLGLNIAASRGGVAAIAGFGGVFFGLCALVFGYQLFKPARLLLEPHGFTYKGMGKAWTVAWRDVEAFGLMAPGGNKMVCWTYAPHYDRQKTGRAISSAISGGAEGALPGLWSMKPGTLLDLMEEARLRWSPKGVAAGK